jgi:hypothetical protein
MNVLIFLEGHRKLNSMSTFSASSKRLEGLFAIPGDLPEIKAHGEEFDNIMIRAGEHPTIDANYPPDAPRTPSPPFRHSTYPGRDSNACGLK